MGYSKIQQPKLANVIEQRIESLILEGTLRPGEKLLPERELARQFEVSRPSVREAIHRLEVRHLLVRRQGGGTYVASDLMQHVSDPLTSLLEKNPDTQFDLLEMRYSLEGMAAYFAALRGTQTDFEAIQACQNQIIQSANQLECEVEAIMQYLLTMAEASHNTVLLHFVQSLSPILRQNVSQILELLYLDSDMSTALSELRLAITAKILAKEPEKAREACHQHLLFIEDAVYRLNKTHGRQERSLRRLQNRQKELG